MPMGVLPVLELPDGRKLSQSLAIARYLGTVTGLQLIIKKVCMPNPNLGFFPAVGLVSSDPFENAWGDQLVGAIEDIYPVHYSNYVMAKLENNEAKVSSGSKSVFLCSPYSNLDFSKRKH